METIRIEKTACPKEKPGKDNPLVFGTIFTDHMFEMDYQEGKAGEWQRIHFRRTRIGEILLCKDGDGECIP